MVLELVTKGWVETLYIGNVLTSEEGWEGVG